jgi:hypothetical protein
MFSPNLSLRISFTLGILLEPPTKIISSILKISLFLASSIA